jgi:heat shock protein HslJ
MKYFFFLLILACSPRNEEQLKTIYIADRLEDCTGVAEQKCMLIKDSPEGEWSYFYDQIDGFDYEEGFEYQLRVEVHKVDNPPADASSVKYILKEVISKVPGSTRDQSGADLLGKWKVIELNGLETLDINPTFEFLEDENRVAGFAGCNNYFSTYSVSGNMLKMGVAGATRKMCPEMTVEDVFLKHLDKIASYKIEGSELHLFDAEDKLLYRAISE